MSRETSPELEHFRELLGSLLGLSFDDEKLGPLRAVMARRLLMERLTAEAYLAQRLRRPEELRELAKELTVTETYFLRHAAQLGVFADVALRPRANALLPLRILCAGCASGEEPYSLALLSREVLPELLPYQVSILAVDVNPAALAKAHEARYTGWSLRETPPETRSRWFRASGAQFVLDPEIRRMVRFEERNLADPDPCFWQKEAFDVVFCRNVLMYFTVEAARGLVRRLAESLVPGGTLFVGHAETLRGISGDFELCHAHDTYYYERRASLSPPGHVTAPRSLGIVAPARDDTWARAIAESARRIHSLAEAARAGEREADRASAEAAWDPVRAAELLHEGRLAEAWHLLASVPADRADDQDAILLRAMLLTHDGDLVAAEQLCTRLLERRYANPGAHYIKALCRESAGDRDGAMDQNLIAAHADPSFAMPRLHLGMLARRAGDLDSARLEFARALSLFEREDPVRLLLFGGGFSRAALVGLCRAELSACGGIP